ncbi:MAG: putative zinc-binding protein [Methanoregulaceae archaeon]
MATLLITCSGLSNVGRLTTAVAHQLLIRHPGRFEWVRALAGPEEIARAATGTSRVVVLDGCEDCCGTCKAREAGVEPILRLRATELGIIKDGRAEVKFTEIETVTRAVLNASEG